MQRGAIAEVGARLDPKLPGGDLRTAGTEGLVLRVRGDGHFYLVILETEDGDRCGAPPRARMPAHAMRRRPAARPAVRMPRGAWRWQWQHLGAPWG